MSDRPQSATPAGTSASQRLLRYLQQFGARLERALWLRAAAILALAALLLTIAGSWVAIRTGFDGGTLALVRLALVVVLAVLATLLLALPLRRLRRRRERAIESLAGEFDGRLRTFSQLPAQHPFRDLLAEDALHVAERHAPHSHVTAARLAVPAATGALLALLLVWLAALGPGLYRDGARDIWAGWLLTYLRPAERIGVDPGNETVRRGGSVMVRSWTQGFVPGAMQLHARVGAGPWQQIDMAREPPAGAPAFDFTFFSVREPVSYYVTAAGIRSPAYRLQVVDVPAVAQLRLIYHYPAWTHRPDDVQEGQGDISAIAGTQVDVQLRTDRPLPAAELVIDSQATPLRTSGGEAHGAIQVTRDARYYLAARIGAERVRLTEDYLIKLRPVPPPQVRVTWPGRDYSASSIEEVTTDVQASDDYGLQGLELHYSVDGGTWHTIALPAKGANTSAEHVMALESLHPDALARALVPGDLVSYYAVARGHTQSAQSDMYFINVQPFDRRYSQSQSGGSGSGGNEQEQISERQREILLSTWNLLRQQQQRAEERAQAAPAVAAAAPALLDNATLLSTLQSKLAAQAESLAGRTQARQLMDADATIARFIDSMKLAARAMRPAAQRLAVTDLADALAPEQQALQYLLQAEAQFKDVQVALASRGAGGSNPQSGRDVSQIYQLEMDLQKNQYESGSGATPESTDQQADQLAQRLQDLARRQQQLAEQLQHSPRFTDEQRWQQQSLQREAEQLQQQLQQLQQQRSGANASQSGQGAQGSQGSQGTQGSQGGQGAPGGQNAQGGQGAPGGQGGAGDALARRGGPAGGGPLLGGGSAAGAMPSAGSVPDGTDAGGQLDQRVAEAIRAMNQAAGAMHADTADAAARARLAAQQAQLAQQALAGASTELARQRAQQIAQQVAQMAERAGQLYTQQAAAQRQLQAIAKADASPRIPGFAGGPAGQSSGPSEQEQLTEQKRELSAGVLRLSDRIASAAQQFHGEAPDVSRSLGDASQALSDSGVINRLDIETQYINEGGAAYVAASDAAVTAALRDLHQRLQLAEGVASQGAAGASPQRDPVTDELARLRALRSQLQQLADATQSNTPGARGGTSGTARGTTRGTTPGSSGAGAAPGTPPGTTSGTTPGTASAGAIGSAGPGTGSGTGAAGGGTGGFNGALLGGGGLGELAGGQRAVAAGAAGLVPLLRAQGADARQLAQIDRLARQLGEANIVTGRALALAQQLRAQIDVLDELELQLAQRGQSQQAIRAAVDNRGAEQYQQAVAEYYRQLSRQ